MVKLLSFRGAVIGPPCKYLSIASVSFWSREGLKMNEYIQRSTETASKGTNMFHCKN